MPCIIWREQSIYFMNYSYKPDLGQDLKKSKQPKVVLAICLTKIPAQNKVRRTKKQEKLEFAFV
jgi:hypothetical protein